MPHEHPTSPDELARVTSSPPRPHSIDFALALEAQLDEEASPTAESFSDRPRSLDAQVLASIVTQLRLAVASATAERDALAAGLAAAQEREVELKDVLGVSAEQCAALKLSLEEAQTKIKDDEDAITMLRSKVEESRRGLMRVQAESKRMSMTGMSIDLARVGPPSSKRASFTPLTGSPYGPRGHRRISSVSDAAFALDDRDTPDAQYAAATAAAMPANFKLTPPSHRRAPSSFGRASPPGPLDGADPLLAEVQELRRELKCARDELEETRHELTEASEAREASETCAKALRDFIHEHSIGVKSLNSDDDSMSIKLPPLPSQAASSTPDTEHSKPANSGWGFNKLWKTDSAHHPTSSQSSAVSPAQPFQSAPTTFAAGPAPTPLTRRITGFFGPRSNTHPSAHRSTSSSPNVPPLPAPVSMHTPDMVHTASDTSSVGDSVVEPASPRALSGTPDFARVRGSGSASEEEGGLGMSVSVSPEQKARVLGGDVPVHASVPL